MDNIPTSECAKFLIRKVPSKSSPSEFLNFIPQFPALRTQVQSVELNENLADLVRQGLRVKHEDLQVSGMLS